jgi:cellulose synthase/poly-beta-1,6-N-acetylglucosamine synthase-like glycosyltransferase
MQYCLFFSLYPLSAFVLLRVSVDGGVEQTALTTFEVCMLVLFAPLMLKFVVGLSLALWHPIVEQRRVRRRSAGSAPKVSVLIPAWNEEVGIAATMLSVWQADYPDLEVIAIDDGSTDGTYKQIKQIAARLTGDTQYGLREIRFRRVRNGGKARALNTALRLATGEIIITIDADSIVERQAIGNLVKHFCDQKVASVAGNVAIGNRNTCIGLLQQLEYLFGFYFKRADGMLNAVYIVGGAAAAYRRSILVEAGGFDETIITEDIELSTRLQALGFKVGYAPDATIFTEGPSDLKSLCLQRLRWKYGRILTFLKFRRLFLSFDRNHNKFLTLFVLPITLYCEALLIIAPFLLVAFYAYALATGGLNALTYVVVFGAIVTLLQIASDRNSRYHRNLVVLAPVAWAVFYLVDAIEYQALMRSLYRLAIKRGPSWQRWQRQGVFGG